MLADFYPAVWLQRIGYITDRSGGCYQCCRPSVNELFAMRIPVSDYLDVLGYVCESAGRVCDGTDS